MDEPLAIVHHGDGGAGLLAMGPQAVDHVIVDPPYSDHVHANVVGLDQGAEGEKLELGFAALTPEERRRLAEVYAQAAKRWILVFCDLEGLDGWRTDLEAAGAKWVRAGIWVREGTMPQVTGDRPGMGAEAIAIAHAPRASGKLRWNGGGRPAVWRARVVNGQEERLHPTQKPIDLIRALVRDFTEPGDLIADTHAGSGTLAAAAVTEGRRAVVWEAQEKHVQTIERRLRGVRPQLDLEALTRAVVKKPKQQPLL